MDQYEHKTLVTKPFDLTYSYYVSPDFHAKLKHNVPIVMLLHGFPDDAHMWSGAIPFLQQLPYPIIVPDLLGFSGSSKPTDPNMYNYKQQADSLAQILDQEGVPSQKSVIPIGHDWGSGTAQRFYLYHRDRCVGLSLLSLAYQIPSSTAFELDAVNAATEKRFGYPQWAYWEFFTAPDAPQILRDNLGRFYEIMHGNYPSTLPEEKGRDIWMREMFCVHGAFREYMTSSGRYEGYTVPLKPYAEDAELRRRHDERLGTGGLEGPVCYYLSLKNNTMLDEERRILCDTPDDRAKKIDVPVLYIGQTGDWVCRTDLMDDAKQQGLVSDVEEHVLQAGHWVLYENPTEIARLIVDWLGRRFPVST